MNNVDVAKLYLRAIASNVSGEDLAKFLGPGKAIEEKPNYLPAQLRLLRAVLSTPAHG